MPGCRLYPAVKKDAAAGCGAIQKMEEAIKMYRQRGFYFIEKYNDNPAKNALLMQLNH